MFPEHFAWKLRVLSRKVTKITRQKAKNNGENTSFYSKITVFLTLPTVFIAFLCINIFQIRKIVSFLLKNLKKKIFKCKVRSNFWKSLKIFFCPKLGLIFEFISKIFELKFQFWVKWRDFFRFFLNLSKITDFKGSRNMLRTQKFSYQV